MRVGGNTPTILAVLGGGHGVRGGSQRASNKREDAAALIAAQAAAAANKESSLKMLKGFGDAKLKKFADAGVKTVEALAKIKVDEHSASRFTENKDSWKAKKRLKEWVVDANAFVKKKKSGLEDKVKRAAARMVLYKDDDDKSDDESESETKNGDAPPPSPVPPFPSFGEFGCYRLSAYTCDAVGHTIADHEEPCQTALMASLGGKILKLDQTFWTAAKVVAKIPGSTKYFKPYSGLASCMNEYGQIVWFGFVYTKESMNELGPSLDDLSARMKANNIKDDAGGNGRPDAIYVDNCCEVRAAYAKHFPGVPALLDCFHLMAHQVAARVPRRCGVVFAICRCEGYVFDIEGRTCAVASCPRPSNVGTPRCVTYCCVPK